MPLLRLAFILTAVLCAVPQAVRAQDDPRLSITAEGAAVWQARNDVRIPPQTGTEFSIVDVIGTGPWAAGRVELTAGLTDRQQLRVVYAPLAISGDGTIAAPVTFAGATFAPGATRADYRFSNYRVTYRYEFFEGERWQWRVGFTGFVRDARIALTQGDLSAEDTDLGFVPLGHLSGTARLSSRWRFVVDVDASAAPQGRAIDLATLLQFDPSPGWHVAVGYRTIEGGADVESVYTFAWINAAVARIGIDF